MLIFNNMLVVPINSSRKVYVEMTEDNGINKGGYFCEIYGDMDKKFFLDSFTIRKEQCAGSDTRKNAMVFAHHKVKEMYK